MSEPAFKLEASFDDKTGQTVAVYLRIRAVRLPGQRKSRKDAPTPITTARDCFSASNSLVPARRKFSTASRRARRNP